MKSLDKEQAKSIDDSIEISFDETAILHPDYAKNRARRTALLWLALAVLFIATFLVWHQVAGASRGGVLTVSFLDVGQGDAIFIESPDGNQVLIDGGPNGAVLKELGKSMSFFDRHIDVVIATHPDQDHIGGLIDVAKRYRIGMFLDSGVESESRVDDTLYASLEKKGVKQMLAQAGMVINLGSGVYLEVLFPDRDVSGIETNTASVIARVTYGDTAFLLTGDSPKAIEEYIAGAYGEKLASEVLKAGHHGSKTSSSPIFVSAVAPAFAVISAGSDNRYGHPHQEVLDTFTEFDVDLSSTAGSGRIVFESNGRTVVRKK